MASDLNLAWCPFPKSVLGSEISLGKQFRGRGSPRGLSCQGCHLVSLVLQRGSPKVPVALNLRSQGGAGFSDLPRPPPTPGASGLGREAGGDRLVSLLAKAQ